MGGTDGSVSGPERGGGHTAMWTCQAPLNRSIWCQVHFNAINYLSRYSPEIEYTHTRNVFTAGLFRIRLRRHTHTRFAYGQTSASSSGGVSGRGGGPGGRPAGRVRAKVLLGKLVRPHHWVPHRAPGRRACGQEPTGWGWGVSDLALLNVSRVLFEGLCVSLNTTSHVWEH